MGTRRYGRYSVEVSNEDKVLFPDAGVTKGDLVDYYERVAPTILPHLKDRLLMMHRFPDGIGSDGFYQKDVEGSFPDWIRTERVEKEGGSLRQVVCDNAATLAYLANQASITLHSWLSRVDRRRHPDRLVVDLDPSEPDDFATVRRGALRLRELLEELGLVPFVQVTGSRGVHVVVPLDRRTDFDGVRAFAREVAGVLAARSPDELTVEQRKDERGGRVFLDTGRNAYAQTMVSPYSVRAKPGAPVAVPIEWDELERGDLAPDDHTVRNLFRRLGARPDPWRAISRRARSLKRPRERLRRLGGGD